MPRQPEAEEVPRLLPLSAREERVVSVAQAEAVAERPSRPTDERRRAQDAPAALVLLGVRRLRAGARAAPAGPRPLPDLGRG